MITENNIYPGSYLTYNLGYGSTPIGAPTTSTPNYGLTKIFSFSSVNGDRHTPNPFSFSKEFCTGLSGDFIHRDSIGQGSLRTGNFGRGSLSSNNVNFDFSVKVPTTIELNSVRNRAVSRFYKLLKDSELSSLVTAGESREALALRKQAMTAAADLISIIKKAKSGVRGVPGIFKVVGGVYLFYSFGIRPIINDIQAWLDFVHSEYAVNPMIVRASSSSKSSVTTKLYSGCWTQMDSVLMKHKFGALVRVKNYQDFNNWRLGISNPVSSAYSLLPLSFVHDWFWDVGTYLDNLENSYLSSLEIISGYETQTWKSGTSIFVQGTFRQPYGTTIFGSVKGRGSRAFAQRKLLLSFPSSVLPSVKLDLGSQQLLSGAALLTQFLIKG